MGWSAVAAVVAVIGTSYSITEQQQPVFHQQRSDCI